VIRRRWVLVAAPDGGDGCARVWAVRALVAGGGYRCAAGAGVGTAAAAGSGAAALVTGGDDLDRCRHQDRRIEQYGVLAQQLAAAPSDLNQESRKGSRIACSMTHECGNDPCPWHDQEAQLIQEIGAFQSGTFEILGAAEQHFDAVSILGRTDCSSMSALIGWLRAECKSMSPGRGRTHPLSNQRQKRHQPGQFPHHVYSLSCHYMECKRGVFSHAGSGEPA